MTEAELQAILVDAAHLFEWSVAHFRAARTKHGWRTPGQYEAGKGWPDLILVRDRVLVWELKGQDARGRTGKPTPDQEAWLDAFTTAGVEAKVITPEDIDDCILVLSRRPTPNPWTNNHEGTNHE